MKAFITFAGILLLLGITGYSDTNDWDESEPGARSYIGAPKPQFAFAHRDAVERLLEHWEAGGEPLELLLTVKPDGAGLVVGIGHEVRAADNLKKGDIITFSQAATFFANDVDIAIASAQRDVPNLTVHPPAVQQVIVAMCFQLGGRGVAGFHQMLRALGTQDYAAAAAAMLDSEWARKQTPHRARAMSHLMQQAATHVSVRGQLQTIAAQLRNGNMSPGAAADAIEKVIADAEF